MRPEDARDTQVGKTQFRWRLDEWVRIIRANLADRSRRGSSHPTASLSRPEMATRGIRAHSSQNTPVRSVAEWIGCRMDLGILLYRGNRRIPDPRSCASTARVRKTVAF